METTEQTFPTQGEEQQSLAAQLEAKEARLQELETEVRYLRRVLNEMLAVPRPQPKAVTATVARPAARPVPLRWKA